MTAWNTRFNPTCDGDLHLGHLFVLKVNEYMARSTGGRFFVRFDDRQQWWLDTIGKEKIDYYAQRIKEDIQRFGVEPDAWIKDSDEPWVEELLEDNGLFRDTTATYPYAPESSSGVPFYPYTPYLTAAVVLSDACLGINMLIGGIDLLSRYSLYCWFCDKWNKPQIRHCFLPRWAGLSKSKNAQSLRTWLDQGATVESLLATAKEICLIDPTGPWSLENVKAKMEIGTVSRVPGCLAG